MQCMKSNRENFVDCCSSSTEEDGFSSIFSSYILRLVVPFRLSYQLHTQMKKKRIVWTKITRTFLVTHWGERSWLTGVHTLFTHTRSLIRKKETRRKEMWRKNEMRAKMTNDHRDDWRISRNIRPEKDSWWHSGSIALAYPLLSETHAGIYDDNRKKVLGIS